MRVRSVTIGTNASHPIDIGPFDGFSAFQRQARTRFREVGLEVQSVRLSTQPFPAVLGAQGASEALPFAQALEALCQAHGIDYCSIGPVMATDPGSDLSFIAAIPEVIRSTETAFTSVLVATQGSGINLDAIAASARAVTDIARSTADGFGNLRLAVLANCGPGSPFFPVSYHGGGRTRFAIATEAADLAVDAFSTAGSLEEAEASLRGAIEEAARVIEDVSQTLAAE
ncbi:MAG: DUF711 family protein, partial [Anaerolineae bacterium]